MFDWLSSMIGFSSRAQEERSAAERACVQYTKALSACLEANSEVSNSASRLENSNIGDAGESVVRAKTRERKRDIARMSTSDAKRRKSSCAGLAGSAAHCLGLRLPSCAELSRQYQRCFVKHGLQPNGGSGSCRDQEKRLIRCIVRSATAKDSGLKEYG